MPRRYLAPWLFLAASFLASGSSAKAPGVSPPPAEAVAKLARSSNEFGCDLYQRLRQKPGNLVISPASLTTALTMAWGGAEGETATQMKKALHLEGTADEEMATSGQRPLPGTGERPEPAIARGAAKRSRP